MVERRTVYRNADGVRRTLITDDDRPGKALVKTEVVLDEIVDGIARDREIMRHGVNKKVASLPLTVYEDLVNRGIAGDEDAFKKWLNSSEATPWRVWQGNV
jgi:hypothetical protein